MNKFLLIYILAFTCASCSKKNNPTPTPDPPVSTKLGSIVKVQTTSKGYYVFAITETNSQNHKVMHKDTLIFNSSYTFQYKPYLNNTVSVEIDWSSNPGVPIPDITTFYNSVELKNYMLGNNGGYFRSMSFTAN